MADWLSYSLSDFVLFSDRTYWRLFERVNTGNAAWISVGLAIAARAIARPTSRAAAIGAALLCASSLWLFVWTAYAPIHWAIVYTAPLLAVTALGLAIAPANDHAPRLSRGLSLYAAAYPLWAVAYGRALTSGESVGLAPDPTAVLALGLALTFSGWRRRLVDLTALLWLAQSALTLYALNAAEMWGPLIALGLYALAFNRKSGRAKG